MKFRYVLILVLVLSAAVHAQRRPDRHTDADGSGYVTNEDQGKAFMITANSQMPTLLNLRRTNNSLQQYSIFLGSGWSSDELRWQEPLLANLISNSPDASRLEDIGFKNVYAVNPYQEMLADLETRVMTDLEIQRILEGMFADASLPRPNAPTIYVIYLDPAVDSTLSGFKAGKHYIAYFNDFHVSGSKVRYVVVPMTANQKQAYSIALSGYLSALIN